METPSEEAVEQCEQLLHAILQRIWNLKYVNINYVEQIHTQREIGDIGQIGEVKTIHNVCVIQ